MSRQPSSGDAACPPGQPVPRHDLGPGAALYVMPTPRFHTFNLLVAFHQRLSTDRATAATLLPRVLRRGTRRWPDLRSLSELLESLYGASAAASAAKLGDHQVVELTYSCLGAESLAWVLRDQRAGPEGETVGGDLLDRGADLLTEMLLAPAPPILGGGDSTSPEAGSVTRGLRGDYFSEEKAALGREIAALADDRVSYAHYRCVSSMCPGEPCAVHTLGSGEALERLTAAKLDRFRFALLRDAPFSAYLTGPVTDDLEERVIDRLRHLVTAMSGNGRPPLPPSAAHPTGRPERVIFEAADVAQARLVIGVSTGVTAGSPLHGAQVIYNGLLGGFVHSRLFRRIREEAGLAYYAWSSVAAAKGFILISCGIREKDYERTLDLIREELRSLAEGRFSADEFEATRNSALAQSVTVLDSPAAMVYAHLEQRSLGMESDEIAPWRELAAITPAEVREFARRPAIDTVYLLARRAP